VKLWDWFALPRASPQFGTRGREIFLGRRFSGYKFRRQPTPGDYYLDFFCEEAELNTELDTAKRASGEYNFSMDIHRGADKVELDKSALARGAGNQQALNDFSNRVRIEIKAEDIARMDFMALDRALRDAGFVAEHVEFGGIPHTRLEAHVRHLCCNLSAARALLSFWP
jgi:uncharacterized protein DUF559